MNDAVMSPDSRFLYVANRGTYIVRVYRSDAITGLLTEVGTLRADDGFFQSLLPIYLAVSPDGNYLYVSADSTTGSLVTFRRDVDTGMATVVQRVAHNYWVDGLKLPRELVLSPDGSRIHIAAYASDSVSTFIRDQTTGKVTPLQMIQQDDPGVDGLEYVSIITVTPDGRHAYAGGSYPWNFTLFERDTLRGHVIELAPGAVESADFGNRSVHGEIRSTKWDDLNGDGVWDAGELAMAGVAIFLDLNENGQLDAGEPNTVTAEDDPATTGIDESGTYALTGVVPGDYLVREVVPVGHAATYPTPAANGSGQLTYVGLIQDSDGIRDAAEPALAGWEIFLDANQNGLLDASETATTTLADGSYTFSKLQPGPYTVAEVIQAGWVQSYPAAGGTGELAFVEMQRNGGSVGSVGGLAGAVALAVSPDGKFLYVIGNLDNAVAVFERHATSGRLTFRQAP